MNDNQLVACIAVVASALIGYLVTMYFQHRPDPRPRHVHAWSKWEPLRRRIVAHDGVKLPEDQQYVLTDRQARRCQTCGITQEKSR